MKFARSLGGHWSLFLRAGICLKSFSGTKKPTEWKAQARTREKSLLMIHDDTDHGFGIA